MGIVQQTAKCENPDCGKSYPYKKNKKYCSKECGKIVCSKNKYGDSYSSILTDKPDIPAASMGAVSELIVCADLIKRGYSVFRAQSPACPCDLVVWLGGKLYRVEVRTGSTSVYTGKLLFPFKESDKGRFDIMAVAKHNGEIAYLNTDLNPINLFVLEGD